VPAARLREDRLEFPFRATAESDQEAILNSMVMTEIIAGRNGRWRQSLPCSQPAWLTNQRGKSNDH